VQVEIDRSLYMDEAAIVPRPDYAAFRQRISGVLAEVIGRESEAMPLAAE
jgi:N-formylglutamate amidohydrolase